mmetsp:Transcript_5597/g.23034  ORF Transcript_5597/g.23034 Transcript_5597/m.23034 type:complete len:227 (-) Transcript_5597:109-789(-)
MTLRHRHDLLVEVMVLDAQGQHVRDERPRVESLGAGVHRGAREGEVAGREPRLDVQEEVEHGERVFAAGEPEQHAVSLLDHVEVVERLVERLEDFRRGLGELLGLALRFGGVGGHRRDGGGDAGLELGLGLGLDGQLRVPAGILGHRLLGLLVGVVVVVPEGGHVLLLALLLLLLLLVGIEGRVTPAPHGLVGGGIEERGAVLVPVVPTAVVACRARAEFVRVGVV